MTDKRRDMLGMMIHIDNLEAEIARLRAALGSITKIPNHEYGGDWDEIELARNIAIAALSAGK